MNLDKNNFLNCLNETFHPENLSSEPKYFKSQNSLMIDMVLINHSSSFMKTAVQAYQFTLWWFSLFKNVLLLREKIWSKSIQ